MDPTHSAEIFPHIRILLGTIVGLGITRLLMTFAGMVQHPRRAKESALHLIWMASILLEIVLFWWWEFALFQLPFWTFGVALFLISYAVTLFLMATLLSPDNISEYTGYEDFFIKRRRWFFGLLALTFVFDTIDTLLKGATHWENFGASYFIQVPIGLILCVIAWRSDNRRVHFAIVGLHITYQIYLMTRFFYVN